MTFTPSIAQVKANYQASARNNLRMPRPKRETDPEIDRFIVKIATEVRDRVLAECAQIAEEALLLHALPIPGESGFKVQQRAADEARVQIGAKIRAKLSVVPLPEPSVAPDAPDPATGVWLNADGSLIDGSERL